MEARGRDARTLLTRDIARALRTVEFNDLLIFEAIMARASVVGAAEQLGLSSSTVSQALGKMCVAFDDALFQRTAIGLQATPLALALADEITAGLSHIANAFDQRATFIPARSTRDFTIQVVDYVRAMLLAPLAQRLRAEAPHVSIHEVPFPNVPDIAMSGVDLQVRFSPLKKPCRPIRVLPLLTDRFVVAMRRDHPAARDVLTLERYAGLNHLRLAPAAVGTAMVDEVLARRGLRRHVQMTVTSVANMLSILRQTDLVAVIPKHALFADLSLARLHTAELPLDEVNHVLELAWHDRNEHDAGQTWLRDVVADIFTLAEAVQ